MINNLPEDLVEDILSRVPLKSMRALRLTCKNWNTLSKSRKFTKMHLDKEATREELESRMVVMMDYNLFLMSVCVVNENPSTEAKGKLTCLNNSEQIKISQVFHCEGLLLCILKGNITKVVVWNPYCGQTRWIKTLWCESYRFRYAVGYENKKNNSYRNHKILRFIDDYHPVTGNKFSSHHEIYDFDADSWTILDVNPHWFIAFDQSGVSLKGNTYWCARERNAYELDNHIICFDFTRERYGPLMPLPFRVEDHDLVTLSCVGEEKLAVLFQSMETFETELWITTKIEIKKISWSKFLTLDTTTKIEGSFFINEEKKVVMVFEKDSEERLDTVKIIGENEYYKELELGKPSNKWCWPSVCSYAPSLVEIKQPKVGKRKKQKSLQTLGKAAKRRKA